MTVIGQRISQNRWLTIVLAAILWIIGLLLTFIWATPTKGLGIVVIGSIVFSRWLLRDHGMEDQLTIRAGVWGISQILIPLVAPIIIFILFSASYGSATGLVLLSTLKRYFSDTGMLFLATFLGLATLNEILDTKYSNQYFRLSWLDLLTAGITVWAMILTIRAVVGPAATDFSQSMQLSITESLLAALIPVSVASRIRNLE